MKPSFRLLLALTPLVTTLHAAVPSTVNYQGIVYDSTGTPIGNTAAVNRKVIFRFYDATTAGTRLWTEEQTVTIYKGEFSVVLGSGTTATGTASSESRPALDTIFTSSTTTRYLEVMVDNGDNAITASDTPISPRQLITTGFYTFHAQVADGIASGSDLTINPVTGTPSYYGLGWYGSGRAWNSTAASTWRPGLSNAHPAMAAASTWPSTSTPRASPVAAARRATTASTAGSPAGA